jgi:hypothetical protein
VVLYYGIIGEYHDNRISERSQPDIYRHVKMGRWQGAISATHVRLAMAMYTMCDVRLWDGDRRRRRGTKKIWRWRATRLPFAMVVRILEDASVHPPLGQSQSSGPRPR